MNELSESKKIMRILAMLVFLSSAVSAFSFAALAYTFITGTLPFGMKSILKERTDAIQSKTNTVVKAAEPAMRINEDYLVRIAVEFQKARGELKSGQARLVEERKNNELLMEQVKNLQKEVASKEKEVGELLKKMDEKERQNVASLQRLVASMDAQSASAMLLSLDKTLAARVIYSMNKKVVGPIMTEAIRTRAGKKQILEITNAMHGLSDELKDEDVK